MNRVKDDPALAAEGEPRFVRNPAIIVHDGDGDGRPKFVIAHGVFDPGMDDPRVFGVLMSDLMDHLAAAYAATTGRDQRDVRADLVRVMRDEDRFKANDPERARARGATIWPKRGKQ